MFNYKWLDKTLAITAGLMVSFSAFGANGTIEGLIFDAQTIYVNSNGSEYTEISRKKHPLNIRFDADASVAAKKNRRINSWKMSVKLSYKGSSYGVDVHDSSRDVTDGTGAYQESYTHLKKKQRPRSVDKQIALFVSRTRLNEFAVNACNSRAASLRSQGSSNNVIFSKNHALSLDTSTYGSVETVRSKTWFTNFIGQDEHSSVKGKIICQKYRAKAQVGDLQLGSGVTQASLTIIKQSTIGGSCKVNLSNVIQTNLPNTQVKYRYEHTNGNKSDIKTVTTDGTNTAMEAHWYDIPNNPNGGEAGSIRMVGVSHPFQSAWKTYDMNCRDKSPASLSEVPKKPTVQVRLLPILNVSYQGMICPSKIRVSTNLRSEVEFNGVGVLTVRDRNFSFDTNEVNLEPFIIKQFNLDVDLKPWGEVGAATGLAGGGNTFQVEGDNQGARNLSQRFAVRYILSANNQSVVQTPYKTIVVRCTAPSVNPRLTPNRQELQGRPRPSVAPSNAIVPAQKRLQPAHEKQQNKSSEQRLLK